MTDALLMALECASLVLALVASPYLLARLCLPSADLPMTVALGGAAGMVLNVTVPVALHLLSVPIAPQSLAAAHGIVAALLAVAARACRRTLLPGPGAIPRPVCFAAAVFVVLVIPVTYLAGIDTYKWQDLATMVRVERDIPWLVHPASLFGFTPRAYPSAQPLLLATVQMLGGLGVDWGYFLVSVYSGLTGIFAAYVLGRRVFRAGPGAEWFALFYALSPVFMRYNHWATGRGIFISLFPLLLLAALEMPRPRAVAGAVLCSLLLVLSHKTGWVALAILLMAVPFVPLLPRRGPRWVPLALSLPSLAAALVLAAHVGAGPSPSTLVGFLRTSITRFGWFVPMAVIGLLSPFSWLSDSGERWLLAAMLLSFPLAFLSDMYGAMIALPFVVLAATAGWLWLLRAFPRHTRLLATAALLLSCGGAVGTVGHRGLAATPPRIRAAARFLEAHDPQGPFRITAPGRAQAQIQAYVSGCPRFELKTAGRPSIHMLPPPPLKGSRRELIRNWTAYLRDPIAVSGIETLWYGDHPRAYAVVIDGHGNRPAQGRRLYRKDQVEIYEAAVPDNTEAGDEPDPEGTP